MGHSNKGIVSRHEALQERAKRAQSIGNGAAPVPLRTGFRLFRAEQVAAKVARKRARQTELLRERMNEGLFFLRTFVKQVDTHIDPTFRYLRGDKCKGLG